MSETSIKDGETNFYGDVVIKLHGEWVPYCTYQNIERELNEANERIKRLEEAGDAVVSEPCEYTFEQWIKAKEDKP